ncbi:MAG: hypothetical protein PHF31_11910 [Methylobacter sp.]|jgi:hypothetical protein|nr:hypothetical protein [Methylobacter sp.]
MSQIVGYDYDDLQLALGAVDTDIGANDACDISLCMTGNEGEICYGLDQLYQEAVGQGFRLTYPKCTPFDGFYECSFRVARPVNSVGANGQTYTGNPLLVALAPIITTVLTGGLIAFGVAKVKDISNAIMPILLTIIGGGIIMAAMLRPTVNAAAQKAITRYLPANYLADNEFASEAKELWRKACEYEGIEPGSGFVSFSENNPYMKMYDMAMGKSIRMAKLQAGQAGPDIARMEIEKARQKRREMNQANIDLGDGLNVDSEDTAAQSFRLFNAASLPIRFSIKPREITEDEARDVASKAIAVMFDFGAWKGLNAIQLEDYIRPVIRDAASNYGKWFLNNDPAKPAIGILASLHPNGFIVFPVFDRQWRVNPATYDEEHSVLKDLELSVSEEQEAVDAYKARKALAVLADDQQTAKLYAHISGEEQTHKKEFEQRILEKMSGDKRIDYLPDSAAYLAETVIDSGWREELDKTFSSAIKRVNA